MNGTATPPDADEVLQVLFSQLRVLFQTFNDPTDDFPPPEDVFIVSSFASGSNLVQHMCYQLLVAAKRVPTDPNGESYIDTTAVVPVLEVRNLLNLKEPHHRSKPQMWKTHVAVTPFLPYLNDNRKMIFCIRNPLDVCRSFLDFIIEWLSGLTVRDPEVRKAIYPRFFWDYFMSFPPLPDGSTPNLGLWFRHVKGWTEHDKGNTLYLIYEDVIKDFPKTIRTIAKFLCVPVTDAIMKQVLLMCDRDRMARNPRTRARLLSAALGLDPEKATRTRLLNGPSFKDIELPKACKDACWEKFYEATGCTTYEQLVDELRIRNKKLFAYL
ncbi:Sulfotransferase 1C3 [Gracilariopsis chorda]|uniref:Sulfotransferase 1C3 n=1 Tax=Gracilariopsis chorda TaxID=448386 RepID=A0A2V3II42_9FLOR|nr:Sulfotransferase 1C3 [Gracilariopsis chorda]|eukprot:PXF41693.1 Sulfotransferase 1C3 [Gracilariopsis chorda]